MQCIDVKAIKNQVNTCILSLIFVSFCCHAEIYECHKQNNQVGFQDKPCAANHIEKIINVSGTNSNSRPTQEVDVDEAIESKVLKSQLQQKRDRKKALAEQKRILLIEKAERKALRIKKREEKLALKTAEKKNRQIKRQKRIAEKIQRIENQLRLGSKLKKQTLLYSELDKERKNLQRHHDKELKQENQKDD